MKRRRRFWVGLAIFLAGAVAGASAGRSPAPARAEEESEASREPTVEQRYEDLARQVRAAEAGGELLVKVARIIGPAVVHIQAKKPHHSGGIGPGFIEETGSGVIVMLGDPPSRHVLTNRHVINSAPLREISIHLSDGRIVRPDRVREDAATDVAVLAISNEDVPYARLGDSSRLEIGSQVLAVGSPFGLSRSITHGIISAKGRRDLRLGRGSGESVLNQDFLQTDAAINPGNSGGPLVNLYGEVVGINTAIASNSGGNEGIGFSIPINLIKRVVNQLLENGMVDRAFLGVLLARDFAQENADRLGLDRPHGALISEVYPRTPAADARLRPGDVILKFNELDIEDQAHLINVVSLTPVGSVATLIVWRDRKEMTVEVTLGDRETLQREARAHQRTRHEQLSALKRDTGNLETVEALGVRVRELTPELRERLGFASDVSGLLVVDVESSGLAAVKIEPFDVIDELERKPVGKLEDLRRILDSPVPEEGLVVRLRRRSVGQTAKRLVVLEP